MPTYEYACRSCGEHLEVVQSFRDDPLTECPACGGALRKVFHPIGVAFKGSGFYKTDSRSSSNGSRSEPAKSTSDTTKSESAPKGDKTESAPKSESAAKSSSSSSESAAAS